jgi:hypothetical protein
MIANLLLEITRRILGIGSANAGADYRTRCRSDAGSAATANCRTERCPKTSTKTSTKNSTADSLGIGLIAQRGDLHVGKLPALLIVIIRLRHRAGADRERRQSGADEPCSE